MLIFKWGLKELQHYLQKTDKTCTFWWHLKGFGVVQCLHWIKSHNNSWWADNLTDKAVMLNKRWESRKWRSWPGDIVDDDVASIEAETRLCATTADVAIFKCVWVEVPRCTLTVGPRPRALNVAVGVVVCEWHWPQLSTLSVTVRCLTSSTATSCTGSLKKNNNDMVHIWSRHHGSVVNTMGSYTGKSRFDYLWDLDQSFDDVRNSFQPRNNALHESKYKPTPLKGIFSTWDGLLQLTNAQD